MTKINRAFRFFISFVLVASTVLTGIIPSGAAGISFKDVPSDAYYAAAVSWALEKRITTGVSPSEFAPGNPCLRAQVVTFLWRYAGSPEPEKTGGIPFVDVGDGSYYSKAVLWAVEKGITTGTSDTTFSPDAVCTRGQVVTFLYRFAGSPKTEFAEIFNDVNEDAYCALSITWAVDKCITNGTSSDRFSPNNECTRAHVVTFLYRYEQNVVEPVWDGVPLLDLAGKNLKEDEVLTRLGSEISTIVKPWLDEDAYQENDSAKLEESGQAVYAWAQKLKAAGIIRNCTYNSIGHTVGFFLSTGIVYVYMPAIRNAYSGAVNDYYTVQAFDELPIADRILTLKQEIPGSILAQYNITKGSGGAASYIDSKMYEYGSCSNNYQTVTSLRSNLKKYDEKDCRVILWRGHGSVYTDEDGVAVACFCLRDKTWESDRAMYPTDYEVNGNQHPIVVTSKPCRENLMDAVVTARFFEKYLPQVNGGLFFSGSCSTAADYMPSSTKSYMANVVIGKGFDCYIAPNNTIRDYYSDAVMNIVAAKLCEIDETDEYNRRKTLSKAIKETLDIVGYVDVTNNTKFVYQAKDEGPGLNFRLLPAWEEEYEKIIAKKTSSWGSVVQLADLDADNVPELLLGSTPGSGLFSVLEAAYTFKDNQAIELKVVEDSTYLSYNSLAAYKKDGMYRIEGAYTLRAGAGNYSSCISTYSINKTKLEMQTVFAYAVSSSSASGTSTETYYKENQKLSSKQEYDREIKSWRKGWSEVTDYPDVTAKWNKKPSAKEIREFIKTYNES